MDGQSERPSCSRGDEGSSAMDGFAKDKGDRAFAFSVAANSHRAPALVVHRAGVSASSCCPWTLQHALLPQQQTAGPPGPRTT